MNFGVNWHALHFAIKIALNTPPPPKKHKMRIRNILLFSFLAILLQPSLCAMDKDEKKVLFDEIKLQTCALNMASEWRKEDLHKRFVENLGEDAAERILNAFVWPSCECILQKRDAETCDAIMKKESKKQLEKEVRMREN